MKDQEHTQHEVPGRGKEKNEDLKHITSESIKNAHAAGDGAMERSLDSIPDEEDLNKEKRDRPQRPQQY